MKTAAHRVAQALSRTVSSVRGLQGGDISDVCLVSFADGTEAVVKSGGPCAAEARMLRAIAATGCRAPQVLWAGDDVLAMTRLHEGSATPAGWRAAGEDIAKLHAATGERYGWDEDTRFGAAPCPADPTDDWPLYWAERRLLAWPEALPGEVALRLEALAKRLPDLLPKHPAPSLLHGDLWSGNVLFDGGFEGVIDPACYYGDGEVDLAMLTLFGRPHPAYWEGYGRPRDGWEARRPLYQLWPALVHLRLFGAGYRGLVESCLDAYQ